jgi:hypothetical protein
MKNFKDLKPGDLCLLWAGEYSNPMIFHSLSEDNQVAKVFGLHWFPKDEKHTADEWLTEVRGDIDEKLWKISEDSLTEVQLSSHKKWREIYEEFSLQS